MNAQGRRKDLKVQKFHVAALKRAFALCEVSYNLINLKNNKDISGKKLRLQVSNFIKICTKSPTFLGIGNMESNVIKIYTKSPTFLGTANMESNVIKICTKGPTFLGIANMEGNNIRTTLRIKNFITKVPLTKDIPTPLTFLLSNNLNDRIAFICAINCLNINRSRIYRTKCL